MKLKEKYGLDLMNTSSLSMFGSEKHKGIGILEGGVDASIFNRFTNRRNLSCHQEWERMLFFPHRRADDLWLFLLLKMER